MKKMIKNLMLVAVAAMAFVGCQNDNDEMNATARKVVLEFVAGFDEDTRATFGEKDGETKAYPTYWEENDYVRVTISDGGENSFTASGNVELPEGEKTSRNAKISVEFNLEPGQELPAAGYITATVGSFNDGEPYISTNQSPTEKSVESMSLIAESAYYNGDITGAPLVFVHAAAYGKMTLSQFNEDAADITKVKVTINDNQTIEITPNNGETKLTTPTIWFTTYGGDVETPVVVETLVVEATVGGGVYTRTIDMTDLDDPLKFTTGRVSAFEVTALTEKPADHSFEFNKIMRVGVKETGWYTFKFANDNAEELYVSFFGEDVVDDLLPTGTFTIGYSAESGVVNGNGTYFPESVFGTPYPKYIDNGKVVVTEDEGVYSVVIKGEVYLDSRQTVEVTFDGSFGIADSNFDSATYYYNYDYRGAYQGWGYIVFEDEFLGTLVLNIRIPNSSSETPGTDLYLESTTYQFYNNLDNSLSSYQPVGGNSAKMDGVGSVEVDVIKNGDNYVYSITINGTENANGDKLNATFVGRIANLGLVVPLANPDVTITEVVGMSVTFSWEPIEGAAKYNVGYYSTNAGTGSSTQTTETTYTYEIPAYGDYYVWVQALPADDDPIYIESQQMYSFGALVDPRTQLETPAVSYTLDGANVTLSWEPVENADGYTVFCYDASVDETVTKDTTSAIYTLPDYGTYNFYVTAVTNDTENYKNSEEGMCTITYSAPKETIAFVSAVAAFNGNWTNVTFSDAKGNTLLVPFGNGGVNYLNAGTWDFNNGYDSGYALGNVYYNVDTYISSCQVVVAHVDGAYDMTFTTSNGNYTFNGSIENLVVPGAEPDAPATEITLTTWNEGEYNPSAWTCNYLVSGNECSMKVWTATDHGANATSLGNTTNYTISESAGNVGNPYKFFVQDIKVGGVTKSIKNTSDTTNNTMSVVNNGDGTFNVTINLELSDGKYIFTYTGGVGLPQLATPTNLKASSTANTVTVSWDAVANATSYYVTCDDKSPQTVTTTTATFTDLTANTEYTVKVVAKATNGYEDSLAASIPVTTQKGAVEPDPEPEPEPATVTVTAMEYTGNPFSGYTFTYTCANGTNITGTSKSLGTGITYALSTSTDVVFNTLSNIKVGSTVATSVSGTISISGGAVVTFNNVVIDGVNYVGSFQF